ncbi:MAG: DUF5666 domain-containing protein [Usitatibacter sp.]
MRVLRHVLAAAALIALAACGGAVQTVGTGGTGAPAKALVVSGPINGFGSLVVNGQHLDESGARLTLNGEADRPVSELALGMVVEVNAVERGAGAIPAVQSIVASALATGVIESIGAAGELRVAGQVVRLSPSTALQGASDPATLRPGDVVRIYGLRNPVGASIDATRLEVARPESAAADARIVGVIGGLAGTRFYLGGQLVEALSATLVNLPSGLANGQFVEVRGAAFASGTALTATRIEGRSRLTLAEGALVAVEDFVTDFAGLQSFRILGQPVDASGATIAGAQPGAIGNGARVEVEGAVSQGRIVASRVTVRAATSQPAPDPVVAVEGVVTDFITSASLRIRDQVVDASTATFSGGVAADLANGRVARATGLLRGATLIASSVQLFAPSEPEGTPLTLSGTVTDFVSVANFRVNGQAVAAATGTVFVNGTASGLGNGRRVQVDGRLMAGVLVASQVTFLPDLPPATQPQPANLSGFITDFASPGSFRVNNQPIAANGQTSYAQGTAANLANGRRVKIEGLLQAGVVTAAQIEFDDEVGGGGAEVEGSITDFTSVARFVVKGQVIDASTATFANGSPEKLAVGRKVHVKGAVADGVLRAATISMEL